MKIRSGFVSNSSSSSFIVISDCGNYESINLDGEEYKVLNEGEREFGWQEEEYYDFDSKVNFSFLQAGDDIYRLSMLKNVLETYTKATVVFPELDDNKCCEYDGKYAYVDHQSLFGENLEMFDNEEKLYKFLFSPNSYIRNDNDNH